MKERFIEFLEKNNCLEQYKANLVNEKKEFHEFLNKTWGINVNWVTLAFSWSHTPQNHAYWNKLHGEWQVLARKYQQEDELELSNN